MKYKYVACIICSACGDRVWSRHRHDMHHCACAKSFIDGGRDYTRIGYGPDTDPPRVTRMRVPLSEWETAQKGEPRWPY